MVICFIPGSAGNRYRRFLNGEKIDVPGVSMHWTDASTTEIQYRYLKKDSVNLGPISINRTTLTHTMDSRVISLFYPEHRVIKIKCPINLALERLWIVGEKKTVQSKSKLERIDRAYDLITWHHRYYTDVPIDYDCDSLIDIETDQTEFGRVARKELKTSDEEFRLALTVFNEHGSNAPILEIYKGINE